MISCVHVANSILRKFELNNKNITPLRLYCLVYLIYSNYLYNNVILFDETFIMEDGIPKLPYIWYKFECYKNKPIKSYALNAIEEIVYISDDNNDFKLCLDEIFIKYMDYSDKDLLNYIRSEGNLINNYSDGEMLNFSDILDDEIKRHEKILVKAKKFKDKLK